MKIEPLKIGPLPLATNLLLAPLAGYSDLAFRLVARGCGGVGLASTPLLCPKGLLRRTRKSMELAATHPADRPIAMQIYGSDADELCQAARWAQGEGADVIDLNMGCPVPKITRRRSGSKLLCDPDLAVRLAESVVRAVPATPVTVKLRLGWDDRRLVAPELAGGLEQVGVAAVVVHGRTAEMRFTGQARWDAIGRVVSAVRSIPVIGNGDVKGALDAQRMIRQTGCHGVMIGRAALSAPWVFRDTWGLLTSGTIAPPPTVEQICQLMRCHFHNMVRYRGQRPAVVEFRKFVSWYTRNLHPCRVLHEPMRQLRSVDDFDLCIRRFLDWRRQREQGASDGPAGPPAEPDSPDLPVS